MALRAGFAANMFQTDRNNFVYNPIFFSSIESRPNYQVRRETKMKTIKSGIMALMVAITLDAVTVVADPCAARSLPSIPQLEAKIRKKIVSIPYYRVVD